MLEYFRGSVTVVGRKARWELHTSYLILPLPSLLLPLYPLLPCLRASTAWQCYGFHYSITAPEAFFHSAWYQVPFSSLSLTSHWGKRHSSQCVMNHSVLWTVIPSNSSCYYDNLFLNCPARCDVVWIQNVSQSQEIFRHSTQWHVKMHVQSKIHTAFSHEGKANTHEPSLALLNLSVIMPQ